MGGKEGSLEQLYWRTREELEKAAKRRMEERIIVRSANLSEVHINAATFDGVEGGPWGVRGLATRCLDISPLTLLTESPEELESIVENSLPGVVGVEQIEEVTELLVNSFGDLDGILEGEEIPEEFEDLAGAVGEEYLPDFLGGVLDKLEESGRC